MATIKVTDLSVVDEIYEESNFMITQQVKNNEIISERLMRVSFDSILNYIKTQILNRLSINSLQAGDVDTTELTVSSNAYVADIEVSGYIEAKNTITDKLFINENVNLNGVGTFAFSLNPEDNGLDITFNKEGL